MEACKMKVDGAHPTTEIDGGKLKLPLQTKESNTFLFTPKQAIHKSVFLDTMKHLLEKDRPFLYTPGTFYGEINSGNKWRSNPDLTKNVNIPDGFYVIDKRSYLTLKLDKDFPYNYLRIEVSLSGNNIGELSASKKELKNILLRNTPGESIMLSLTCSQANGFKKEDIPSDYWPTLGTQRKPKKIIVKTGHFTSIISRSDIIDDPPTPENVSGMRFVHIKPGTFIMGSSESEINRAKDEDQHNEVISKDFYLQTTEVSQGQWKEIMKEEPWRGKNDVRKGADYPAVYVSWDDCQKFIRRLNTKDKKFKYRLPSEKEWEYACRAGSTTSFSWGDTYDCSKANFGAGSFSDECVGKNPGGITKVGKYEPNSWGLYDMHGNVWEWCEDKYEASDRSSNLRLTRSGSWHNISRFCRSANRGGIPANMRFKDQGLRLIMEKR
jgi:formylglycine-generating enzyme required for sulfatase activity